MSIPVKSDYTRSHITDRLLGKELQVGDAVYYLSHTSRFAIKKSTIVAKKEIPFSRRLFLNCKLTLADGTAETVEGAVISGQLAESVRAGKVPAIKVYMN